MVEPDGYVIFVPEVTKRENDLVRWPANDKAATDNHWRHDSVTSSFAHSGTSDRTHLKIATSVTQQSLPCVSSVKAPLMTVKKSFNHNSKPVNNCWTESAMALALRHQIWCHITQVKTANVWYRGLTKVEKVGAELGQNIHKLTNSAGKSHGYSNAVGEKMCFAVIIIQHCHHHCINSVTKRHIQTAAKSCSFWTRRLDY